MQIPHSPAAVNALSAAPAPGTAVYRMPLNPRVWEGENGGVLWGISQNTSKVISVLRGTE